MKKTIIIISVISAISGCVKEKYELNEIEWNPNIAVPLVHSRLTLADILEHTDSTSDIHDHLFEDGTGFLTLIYNSTLFSVSARDMLDTFLIYPPGTTIYDIPWGFTDTIPTDSLDLNLELFNKAASGSFYFHDPKIHIYVTNSFGVPIDVRFPVLFGRSFVNTPPIVPIEINGNTGMNIILVPPIAFPLIPGQTAATTYSYDKSNSNIQDVLAIAPKYIYYGVIAYLNSPPVSPNFVSDTSKFSVEVEIELPLWGNASNFVLADTLEFDLDLNTDTFTEVEYAIFRVNTDNGFPIDVNMQLYFIDSLNPTVILDSLIINPADKILISAIVDTVTNKVIQPSSKFTEIYVDKNRLDKISPASQVVVTGTLGTGNEPPPFLVKFYSDYTIDFKLGVRAQLKTTL